jgi:phospholipase C
MRAALPVLVLLLLQAGCASGAGQARPSPPATPAPPAQATAAAPGSPTPLSHVFLIVMENKSYSEAMAAPYTAQLAAQYQVATGYHAVSHPSLPNYLALAGGSTFGITDDGYHRLPAGGIGYQLTGAGVPWKAYMEGMTAGCTDSPYPYALKHNPFAYFGGACPPAVVRLTSLDQDLAGPAAAVPRFAWITPDLCHDTHDCAVSEGDRFLQVLVPKILASDAWRQGGVLYVVWDEDDGSSRNLVPALVIAPGETVHSLERAYDHYSLLAAVEDRLGVDRLGQAARARPLNPI